MIENQEKIQFALSSINLVFCGAILALGLTSPDKYAGALLVIPLISFTLFLLWVHYGIVIRHSADTPYQPVRDLFWETMKTGTFSLSILINYALIPLGSMLMYSQGGFLLFRMINVGIIMGIVVVYIIWFYGQYVEEN